MAVVIESGEAVFASGDTLNTYSISDVGDISKTRVEIQINAANGSTNHTTTNVTTWLPNTTTLQLRRTLSGEALTVYYYVIVDDEQTVEWATITVNARPTNILINDVGDLTKAYSLLYSRWGDTFTTLGDTLCQHWLSATNNLVLWMGGASRSPVCVYQVVKNNRLSVQSLQGSAFGETFVSISSIDEAKAMLSVSFDALGSTVFPDYLKLAEYDTPTTIRVIAYTAFTMDYALYVVTDPKITVQSGLAIYTGSWTSLVISSVNTSRSFARLHGERGTLASVNNISTNLGEINILCQLQNSTQINLRRTNNGGASYAIGWAVIEYAADAISTVYPFLKKVGKYIGKNIGNF